MTEDMRARGGQRTAAGRGVLVLAAVGFVLLYFSVDFVVPNLATSALPLPDAPAAEVREWFADNTLAAVLIGLGQLLSVSCLAAFTVALRRRAVSPPQVAAAGRAYPCGLAAAAFMALSSALSWTLAGVAAGASLETVSMLRTAGFVAGGTAHVVVLGVFVWLATRTPGFGRAARVLAWIAVVPSVASLVSLVVFEGAALILLGRLLCMLGLVVAALTWKGEGR